MTFHPHCAVALSTGSRMEVRLPTVEICGMRLTIRGYVDQFKNLSYVFFKWFYINNDILY